MLLFNTLSNTQDFIIFYQCCFGVQVSACIPVLRLSRHRKKVLFYCHFPDQLLTQRKSMLKKLYRAPIDWLEERTTGMADMVGVRLNSGVSVISRDLLVFASLGYISSVQLNLCSVFQQRCCLCKCT